MCQYVRKNASVALVLVMLFSAVLLFSPMQRVMAVPAIVAIDPKTGFVGSTITVDGTIDTPNGFFTIRWNETLNVATGQAADVNVHTSFTVPQTVGAPAIQGRNITIELIDDLTGASPPVNFTLFTKFDMSVTTPTAPRQVQEGSTVPIAVNVTGGEGNRVYTANITVRNPANQNTSTLAPLSNTSTIGRGDATKIYPKDFAGAHLNYTGKYVVTSNVTNIPQEFTVGLTDKLEYRRNETVQIQAAGYHPSEPVLVSIKTGESSVAGFPKNVNASLAGSVTSSWKVPLNATRGKYSVSITNSTSDGTVKTLSDDQDFEILGVACRVQTINRAGEPVKNALVEVHNATTPSVLLLRGYTNSTGGIRFNLDDGNYTFKAFFKNVEVGSLLNRNVTVTPDLNLPLELVNLAATVETEESIGVPFIDVALKYSFTTRDNKSVSEILSMSTNLTGIAELHNLLTNETYVVEARRYALLFSNTTLSIEPSPASAWFSLLLKLPTYTFNVHTVDAKDAPASGVQIRVYEWTSGVTTPVQSLETNGNGDASFTLPFGIYKLRAYKDDTFLDETVLHLIADQLDFTFSLSTVNIDVTVSVFDYFGNPISNAEVKVERVTNQEYVLVDTKWTGGGGSVLFASIPLGGDSRISVYVAGKLVAVKTQFLGTSTNQVVFNVGGYVTVLGYPIETSLFALFSFIPVLVVVFALLNRKRLFQILRRKPKS